jgi:hypothetical protein
MGLVAGGDELAFDVLYRRHFYRLVCILALWNRGEEFAEDTAQEAFLRVWSARASWRRAGFFRPWLNQIAHRCAIDLLRKGRPGPRSISGWAQDLPRNAPARRSILRARFWPRTIPNSPTIPSSLGGQPLLDGPGLVEDAFPSPGPSSLSPSGFWSPNPSGPDRRHVLLHSQAYRACVPAVP